MHCSLEWQKLKEGRGESSNDGAMFIEKSGVYLFLFCLKAFPFDTQLLLIMLRLLGNVAEVKELRCHLVSGECLTALSQLLNHKNLEVSYSASRIISLIASEEPETWFYQTSFPRFKVLKQLGEAIDRWNLDAKFVTNYRSLKPILQLLRCPEDIPEVQLWVVWTLANLTNVNPAKYCPLLMEEGGIQMLCCSRFNSATLKISIGTLSVSVMRIGIIIFIIFLFGFQTCL
ncbi:Protein zer-1 [Araneus ventricosus]|uniref:Protein zer-1 n=1 Tax=Araneus ventricosus TaxID=182803 RepID=A0A4Y2KA00_ARAVE|nr:Protein zer-1 [Araneus ventricosus]